MHEGLLLIGHDAEGGVSLEHEGHSRSRPLEAVLEIQDFSCSVDSVEPERKSSES